ncbi:MAG: glycoside hydrolase family 43 C-terminal domain-containing protein, partial [Nibricoccus sp.]
MSTTVASQIPGDYKLINHGNDTTSTVKTSSVITLAGTGSSGTITGAVTGTWQLSSDHYATLVISGTTYRGVFSRQWDDDRCCSDSIVFASINL